MENDKVVPLQHICKHYNVELSFFQSLNEFGLVEIIKQDDTDYIETEHLADIERMVHLHYDLEINIAGLDAIGHLLKRVHEMQTELTHLRNKINML